MLVFHFLCILSLLVTIITADEKQTPLNMAAQDTDTGDLILMVSNLTNMLEEKQRMMFEFHSEIVEKLEKQTEILALLLKKGKRGNETRKAPTAKITTLAPSSSKMVSLPSVELPSKSNWSYSNQSAAWLSDYPDCGKENQSPIDLHTVDVSLKDHKSPISFSSYDLVNRDTCVVVNNGNTAIIQMKTNDDTSHPILSGGPFNSTEYSFTHAVFHWGADNTLGSEHTIRGTTYPMEMQLIHQTSSEEENKLAIASFLFEISEEENPFLASFITAVGEIKTAGTEAQLDNPVEAIGGDDHATTDKSQGAMDMFSMDILIKDSISGPYFTYSGSLTYPPCTEVKQYVVFRVPLDISSTQLEQFRLLLKQDETRMVNNFRPVKTLGDRVLAFTVGN